MQYGVMWTTIPIIYVDVAMQSLARLYAKLEAENQAVDFKLHDWYNLNPDVVITL